MAAVMPAYPQDFNIAASTSETPADLGQSRITFVGIVMLPWFVVWA